MAASAAIQYRRATPDDLPNVQELIEPFVAAQQLLPRTVAELRKLLDTAYVAVASSQRIVGFAAVEVYSRKLAELQCLAVATFRSRPGHRSTTDRTLCRIGGRTWCAGADGGDGIGRYFSRRWFRLFVAKPETCAFHSSDQVVGRRDGATFVALS